MYYSKPLTFNISVKFQKRPLTEAFLSWHVMSCVCMISHIWLFTTPWTVAHQAPLSVEFSREEYWSKLPFPSAGDLPDPGIEPTSLESPVFLFSHYARWWVWDTERISSLPKIHSSTIKDRNGEDLVEAEEIKKRWKNTQKNCTKYLKEPDDYDAVVCHPEPDILES